MRTLNELRIGRRRFLAGAAALGAGALAAACLPGGTPSPGSGGTATPAAAGKIATTPRITVRLGVIRGIFDGAYFVAARDAGIYDQYGITLDLVDFQDDITLTRGILTGDLLTGEISPNGPLSAMANGEPLKFVAITYGRVPFVYLAQQSVTDWKALEGRTSGIGGPGDFNQVLQFQLFKKYGVDRNRVTFANIGPTPQIFQALVAGRIDAGTGLYVHDLLARNNPNLKRMADIGEEFPDLFRWSLAVRQQEIDQRPDNLRRFLVAHSAAYRWAVANKEAVVKAAVEQLNFPAEVAGPSFDAPLLRRGVITPDFTMSQRQFDAFQQANIDAGVAQRLLPYSQIADERFVRDIREILGPALVPVISS